MVRGATELSGLRDIKTVHSSKKRSLLRVQSSAYLDLYMLQKEKDRLKKELYILNKRKKNIRKKLDETNTEMEKVKNTEERREEADPEGFKKTIEKDWKTMSIKY